MSFIAPIVLRSPGVPLAGRRATWLVLLCAALLVYVPTLRTLWEGTWQDDRHSHGPVLLLVALWLFWHRFHRRAEPAWIKTQPGLGWALLILGLVLHALGRSQSFVTLEVLSVLPVTVGISLICGGVRLFKELAFCHFFLLFLVPIPDLLADAMTQPLKLAVSVTVEHLLRWSGHEVARVGVTLVLPPYQLLVADACSGLSSLFMLEAFGLLYLNVVRHTSARRNVLLALLIVPISFTANVLRVLFLAVLTVHQGDAVASGIVHGMSGVILFVPALFLTVGLDGVLRRWAGQNEQALPLGMSPATGSSAVPPSPLSLSVRELAAVCMASLASVGVAAAWTLEPQADWMSSPGLAQAIPEKFGAWSIIQNAPVQVNPAVSQPGARTQKQPYDEVVQRTYGDQAGRQVMLTVAYAYRLQQEVKIHRPPICYAAQGFEIKSLTPVTLDLPSSRAGEPFRALRMEASRQGWQEVVLYWIRVGDQHSESVVASRLHILARGLMGQATDGVLVRVSALRHPGESTAEINLRLAAFLRELYPAVERSGAPSGRLLW